MIKTYTIDTSMGTTRDDLPFLNEKQMNEFNNIGYTGKGYDGIKTNRATYLNKLGLGEFEVDQTKCDNGDFSEQFIITHVVSNIELNAIEVIEELRTALFYHLELIHGRKVAKQYPTIVKADTLIKQLKH